MIFKSIFISFCALSLVIADNSPVFLWGANSEQKPALTTLTKDEFSQIIDSVLADSMVVVFVENHLNARDLSTCQINEDSCYSHLREVSPQTYYTSVENPVESLKSFSQNKKYVTVDSAGNLQNDITYSIGEIVFVMFDDGGKVDAQTLRTHDSAMDKVYNTLSKLGKTLGVYTGNGSPILSRRVRQGEDGAKPEDGESNDAKPTAKAATENAKMFEEKGVFLLYFTYLGILNDNTLKEVDVNAMSILSKTADGFDVELTGTDTVKFHVGFSVGYYQVKSVVINSETFVTMPIMEAPTGFSYFCGNRTIPTLNSTSKIQWNSLQFQASKQSTNSTNADNMVFGDPWHCVGFVSIGILSGLFVTLIMIIIISIGICWIMDINTMDRFDDPKGKTITINAAE